MKLPQNLIAALMEESHSFRLYAASILFDQDAVRTVEKVHNIVRCATGKIDAIKKVREFFSENEQEFRCAFRNVEINYDMNNRPVIGLATTKRFVESIRNFD